MTPPLILKSGCSPVWKSALTIPKMTLITRLSRFSEGLTAATAEVKHVKLGVDIVTRVL